LNLSKKIISIKLWILKSMLQISWHFLNLSKTLSKLNLKAIKFLEINFTNYFVLIEFKDKVIFMYQKRHKHDINLKNIQICWKLCSQTSLKTLTSSNFKSLETKLKKNYISVFLKMFFGRLQTKQSFFNS
jgi:hypothetical protein